MAISFRCEHCGMFLKADHGQQKKELPCPKCDQNVVVPIEVGPCPKCSTLMENHGRRWHISLLVFFLGGAASISLILVSIKEEQNIQNIIMGIFAGIILGLTSILIGLYYIKQLIYRCPTCGIWMLARHKVTWAESDGKYNCPHCKIPMTNIERAYKIAALFIITGGLFCICKGFWDYSDLPVGIKLWPLVTGILLLWLGYKRWFGTPLKCKKCGLLIFYMPQLVKNLKNNS